MSHNPPRYFETSRDSQIREKESSSVLLTFFRVRPRKCMESLDEALPWNGAYGGLNVRSVIDYLAWFCRVLFDPCDWKSGCVEFNTSPITCFWKSEIYEDQCRSD